MTWKKDHVMDTEKNHVPLVNKKQSYEKKKKKLNQERTRDWMKIKTANFKEVVNWDRVKLSQP